MQVVRLVSRLTAAVVPAALVLTSTGTALAAKPAVTPVPVLTSKPANPSNATTATFAWTAATSTTYRCSLDGVAAACTSPRSYSGLANGAHAFKLTATATGKRASTASYGWSVDTVAPAAPVVSRTSPATSPAADSSASFSLSDAATDLAGYRCSLDGAAYTTCTTPVALSGMSTGSHALAVRAADKAGNLSPVASSAWVVDVTPPAAPVVTGPGRTKSLTPSVGFSAPLDAVSFACALDAGAAAPCTSPWTPAAPLGEGDHTLQVTAADALGNASTPGSAVFTVDTTGPGSPVLVTGPPALTAQTDVTVRFSDAEATTTFTCSLDAAPASSCSSPFTASGLADGAHTLDVLGVDGVGNTGTTPLHVAWTVDSTAPATARFLTTPGAFTSASAASFTWEGTDATAVGFLCSTGGAFSSCGTSADLTGLTSGTYSFSVAAVDGLGNASDPVTYTWTVDTSAPTSQPSVGGGLPADSGPVSSTPTFVLSSTDPAVAGFVCKLDGATDWTPCASGYSPAVGDGAHTVLIATVDQAGNVGPAVQYSWTLDTTRPAGVVTFPTTLAGAAKVSFAEPVLGVTAATVRLLVAGTATAVGTTASCLGATGTAVSCGAAAGVRAVVLSHAARLVPGQRYVVSVSTAVHDLAGNSATSPGTVYRALRVLQEGELAVGQAWASKASTSAYGSRYLQARYAGASAAFSFRGTSVTWYTATGPAMGTARVYCGSTYKSTVNNYSATGAWHVARTVRCSTTTAGNVLRVVATGLKGSTAGKGTYVVLDAVKLGTTLTTNPAVTQRWATAATSLASGGRYALADQAGEAFALTFRGTSITWRTLVGPSMGKAKVYVDGVYKGTFDQFATTTKAYNRTWKLADKVHTIKVVATGTRRTGATGTRVALDALTVG